ncbi:DUF371 domain-containing protein [Haloparvum sedimenti]|uniref:DUF371 domain-containing protein n=1 Tax=Haloparvum sedimenti TaxID=1678448 RepID=UPI00071E6C4A|nr:DUF371 domain-containing protein [Haloparvum sedimenti]
MSDDDADAAEQGDASDALMADEALVETIHARGHENVTAEHASTFEVTTDDWLTPAGDCILAVDADRAPRDFSQAFREACRSADATITATITATLTVEGGDRTHEETITGRGDPGLALVDDRSLVGRTSDYTDDERTIVVDADKAAADLDRDLVAALADGADCTLRLEVSGDSR